MSMLAETRRRGKWAYNPQGKNLANKGVGRGMLEKMGWKDGEGLGSDGKGIVDPIAVKYKNDSKGVGFKGNPDAVLAHQDDFEALLQGLSTQHQSSVPNSAKNSDEEGEGSSDGGGGKTKKNRHRYHKSRRAKDTSNYKADDIECIVGKAEKRKKAREEQEAKEKEEQAKEAEDMAKQEAEKPKGSFLTINKGSADDYFKQKMAEKMAKLGKPSSEAFKLKSEPVEADDDDELLRPSFGGAGLGSTAVAADTAAEQEPEEKEQPAFVKFQTAGTVQDYFAAKMAALKAKRALELTTEPEPKSEEPESEEPAKKKKKSKKDKSVEQSEEGSDDVQKELSEPASEMQEQPMKKKKKTKKEKFVEELSAEKQAESCAQPDDKPAKKKKKSKKEKTSEMTDEVTAHKETELSEPSDEPEDKPSKKKKRSKKEKSSEVANGLNELKEAEPEQSEDKPVKKKKKNKKDAEDHSLDKSSATREVEPTEEASIESNEEKPSKKKKKSKKEKSSAKSQEMSAPDDAKSVPAGASDEDKKDKVSKKKRKMAESSEPDSSEQAKKAKSVGEVEEELSGYKGTNLLTLKGYGRW